jgi:hypothetical protein
MGTFEYPRLTFLLLVWMAMNVLSWEYMITPEMEARDPNWMPVFGLGLVPPACLLTGLVDFLAPRLFERDCGVRMGHLKYPRFTFLLLAWLSINLLIFVGAGVPERIADTIIVLGPFSLFFAGFLTLVIDTAAPRLFERHDDIDLGTLSDAEVAESKKDDFVFDESKSLKGNIEELRKRQDGS